MKSGETESKINQFEQHVSVEHILAEVDAKVRAMLEDQVRLLIHRAQDALELSVPNTVLSDTYLNAALEIARKYSLTNDHFASNEDSAVSKSIITE